MFLKQCSVHGEQCSVHVKNVGTLMMMHYNISQNTKITWSVPLLQLLCSTSSLFYCSLAVTSLTCKAVVTCDLCHSPVICHLTTCHFHIWRLCTTPSSYPNPLDFVNLGLIFATLHSQVHDTASSSGSHMITPDYLYLVP